MSVSVRFAPSPTGPLHMGGVRTALYNYLFAKKQGGKFILRIEDTDQNRYVPGAEQYIMDALRWCGIQWDEGPDTGGIHAPYRQSERKEFYSRYAMQLLEEGHAYYAFDTPEELEAMRNRLEAERDGNPQYDNQSRMRMTNSLTLSQEEVQKKLAAGEPHVIRIRMPEDQEVLVRDIIRGEVRVSTNLLDDKVLFKSDGMPTYHLANVVDDHLMEITHVIRGEEWLPSAPLHVMLYRMLGWEDTMPAFAHLPLLLKPDGPGKLSKRDGDRLGFPVFPLEWKDESGNSLSSGYRETGYFHEAFVNMLALLGWNPGTDQEIFSMEELVNAFSLERVGKSGSRFDPEKAKWFNHQYMLLKPTEELTASFAKTLNMKGINPADFPIETIVSLVKNRVSFVHEMWDQSAFFFKAPQQYDEGFVRKKWKEETPQLLKALSEALQHVEHFEPESIEAFLNQFMEDQKIGPGKIMPGLRLSLVGAGQGPEVKNIIHVLGKEEVIRRINDALEKINLA